MLKYIYRKLLGNATNSGIYNFANKGFNETITYIKIDYL